MPATRCRRAAPSPSPRGPAGRRGPARGDGAGGNRSGRDRHDAVPRGLRYRNGDGGGHPRPRAGAVLHHQGRGQGDRARPVDGARPGGPVARPPGAAQPAGRGHHRGDLAAGGGAGRRRAAAASRRRVPRPAVPGGPRRRRRSPGAREQRRDAGGSRASGDRGPVRPRGPGADATRPHPRSGADRPRHAGDDRHRARRADPRRTASPQGDPRHRLRRFRPRRGHRPAAARQALRPGGFGPDDRDGGARRGPGLGDDTVVPFPKSA